MVRFLFSFFFLHFSSIFYKFCVMFSHFLVLCVCVFDKCAQKGNNKHSRHGIHYRDTHNVKHFMIKRRGDLRSAYILYGKCTSLTWWKNRCVCRKMDIHFRNSLETTFFFCFLFEKKEMFFFVSFYNGSKPRIGFVKSRFL